MCFSSAAMGLIDLDPLVGRTCHAAPSQSAEVRRHFRMPALCWTTKKYLGSIRRTCQKGTRQCCQGSPARTLYPFILEHHTKCTLNELVKWSVRSFTLRRAGPALTPLWQTFRGVVCCWACHGQCLVSRRLQRPAAHDNLCRNAWASWPHAWHDFWSCLYVSYAHSNQSKKRAQPANGADASDMIWKKRSQTCISSMPMILLKFAFGSCQACPQA